ncbi:MAG: glycosyltransferase family 4 protein [Candidatus Moranbacteria bacterium]|nr:glycosyltransferase family 4 protein [Candidatus Moranbacteria bacterium]
MRILVIAPTPFFADRGTHIRILEESLALEKLGHKITIATYHIGRDIQSEVKTNMDIRRIHRLLFWYKKLEAGPDWQKIILDILLLRKVFYLTQKQKPEIIYAHLHEGVFIGWIVQKLLFRQKIRLVADFHGSLTKEMVSHNYLGGGLLLNFFKKIETWIDNLGDFAVASSWENSEEIQKIRKNGEVETVLDGVNLDYYSHLPEKIESKKELELPLDKIIIAYTGALVPNKGTAYLFEAIKKVLEKSENFYFIIAGFPIENAEIFVKNNNLAKSIRLIHPLNYFDLPQILNASDIGIDPKDSTTRQASGKILQYMGAGLPVICFNRENNRKYLGDGGIYSEKISAESLAEKILEISNSSFLLKEKGLINKKRAENFSWNKSINLIQKILCA